MPAEARVFVGIGSNLGDPVAHVRFACRELARLPRTRLIATSPWYRSAPVGPGEQGDYLNGVAELKSALSPEVLLQTLHAIESAAGRVRAIRWGSRTLDLDLLLHGAYQSASSRLSLPHPRITERNFVVFPLSELAPGLVLPDGSRVQSLRARLQTGGLRRLGISPEAFHATA